MAVISRGFFGRKREENPELPPGQYLTEDFPVLSAGPTPVVDLADWTFSIQTESGEVHAWNWEQLNALPQEDIHTDIHCVTRWSKLGTTWSGVSLDTLFAGVDTTNAYVMVHSYGGYTTNMPLADLMDGKAWIATSFEGEPLDPEHGGPARLLVPHLYFWKSAKWVHGLRMVATDDPGFWEQNGYHIYGDPWLEQRYW
ncbi:DMSO/TMAO reductase YedYZ molybdopterin-dependent catalytic subunit [Glaciihabitans tibetensis]|uniref:DMSO/TMAO reductase YedYZ molybdopterin-dependent catalytic subunit n=1 Tax=Glaciihabitans tibetensis TaxID=1266600 RepID=A0A2T0VFQ8_9MICO|nr:sulfite oxidase-like oxidoreductase [Glaciihabitans tibetensis]PRY69033.1 DMSO/TMAO reductase YedYZ molybdopterin-dependent catalytic subunit [Glaciihabitans tibetensis]